MFKSLWIKFLILLLGVAVLTLSGTIVLRELMLKDFRAYLEGETEDERLEMLHEYLTAVLPRLKKLEEVERIIRSDGYL